jgi:type I restriction enzyme S subunit
MPNEWNFVRLRYLCNITTGNSDTQDADPDGEYLFYVRSPIIERSTKYTFDGEGILMAGDGAGAGRVFHHAFGKYAVHQRVYRLYNFKINSNFLFYYVSNLFPSVMDKGSAQSTVPSVRLPMLLNFEVCTPPLAEQQRIADFLDEKCGEIDSIRSDIQKQIDILNDYKKSVITEAVTKGLDPRAKLKDSGIEWIGKIPEGWDSIKAKYLFKQRNSKGNTIDLQLLSPSQKFGVIPQSKLEELTTQKVVKLNEKVNLAELKTIHQGDFCISLRSFQGGFEYSEYEGVVSPAYQVFYSIVSCCNGYYRYLFKEKSFIEKMNSFTMSLRDGKNIAFEDFANSEMPVPPLSEQKAIADYLDEKCSEINATIADKQRQLETLDEYKKSLIFEYVTGKKEVLQ